MNKNYQLLLDKTINEIKKDNRTPSLLLHVCCAPCSSYVLEYLNEYFNITVLFYNPNITDKDEYDKRATELKRLIDIMPQATDIDLIVCDYNPIEFTSIAKGYETEKEGGQRCLNCYELRLRKTAQIAAKYNFDYFTTTLSISPHKNAQALNEIGECLSLEYNVKYLYSDFKKKNGYKRSCELSKKYDLYRQDYCGCIYSKINRDTEN